MKENIQIGIGLLLVAIASIILYFTYENHQVSLVILNEFTISSK